MKLTQFKTTPLDLRFQEPYHWAGRVDLGTQVVLLEVATDEGITGYGEAIGRIPPAGAEAFLRQMWPLVQGESPFNIERLAARLLAKTGFNQSYRFANYMISAIEVACWDIIGKAVGRPIYQLLGGAYRPEVDYFAFLQGDRSGELAEDAREAVRAGFSVIYMKVGRGEALDMENVAAVRAEIGDRRLRLDANEAWDPATAIYMINQLAKYQPDWIEQPTRGSSLAALLQVKESVSVPIAADQSVTTLTEVYEVCRQRASDALVISINEAGGLLAFRKVAAVAEAAGLSVNLHGRAGCGVVDVAQHHVALTIPNLTEGNQIMGQLLDEQIVLTPEMAPGWRLRSTESGGRIGVIDRPGLGLEFDWDALGRAAERYRREKDQG